MAASDHFLTIDTPENVIFGYEVAGLGSRFLAAAVDSSLILLLEIGITGLVSVLNNLFNLDRLGDWLVAVYLLAAFALLWGYYIVFETLWNGQTPGKRWAKLRVIRIDGLPISLSEALVRNLVRLVDFLPLLYAAGVVAMFLNAQARRLGDLAAGTLVVYDQGATSLEGLRATTHLVPPPGWAPEPGLAALPVERLAAADIELAEQILQRFAALPQLDAQPVLRLMLERLYQALPDVAWPEKKPLPAKQLTDLVWLYRYRAAQRPSNSG